jgi:outer membrane receptor for ferrienterochelin and colicins
MAGGASSVTGISLEGRISWNQLLKAELSGTFQRSLYNSPVEWSAQIPAPARYMRAPDQYGYYTLTFTPTRRIRALLSGVYTGPMLAPFWRCSRRGRRPTGFFPAFPGNQP